VSVCVSDVKENVTIDPENPGERWQLIRIIIIPSTSSNSNI
jgi:hypothetical protein